MDSIVVIFLTWFSVITFLSNFYLIFVIHSIEKRLEKYEKKSHEELQVISRKMLEIPRKEDFTRLVSEVQSLRHDLFIEKKVFETKDPFKSMRKAFSTVPLQEDN